MEVYERIRILRKNYLKMSQTEFGERLGVSRAIIKNIELNALAKPEQKLSLIKLICKEFNVNESWIMDGEGDMFISSDDANIEKLERILKGENSLAKNLFKTFIAFDEEDWEALNRMIEKFNSIDAEALTLFDSIPASPEELEKKFPPVEPKNHKNTAG